MKPTHSAVGLMLLRFNDIEQAFALLGRILGWLESTKELYSQDYQDELARMEREQFAVVCIPEGDSTSLIHSMYDFMRDERMCLAVSRSTHALQRVVISAEELAQLRQSVKVSGGLFIPRMARDELIANHSIIEPYLEQLVARRLSTKQRPDPQQKIA